MRNDLSLITQKLANARSLVSTGRDEEAKAAYIEVLQRDPTHFAALNELGTLAYASGHRSAARTAYEQAVKHHPHNPVGRVNLGNVFAEDGRFEAARAQFDAALESDPNFAEAHQGLARVLPELGEAAEPHWQKGFAGHALVRRRYRGKTPSVPVLLLVSAKGGNIPTQHFLDDRIFEVSALYAEFHDPAQPLPPHRLVLNAISDADLSSEALSRAEEVVARTKAPVVNSPALIRATGRMASARRLAGLSGVIAPAVRSLPRAAIAAATNWKFPLLLRTPGFHTGRYFRRVDRQEDLAETLAALPGEELLVIQYVDARGSDGMARKYRAMIINGELYPLHLAISSDWKVHYFTSEMAGNAAHRDEERRFLEDMPGVLGLRAIGALAAIGQTLRLDYAGVDFALAADGSVQLFEANATMVVNPPEPDSMWDYRRAPIKRALDATQSMLLERACHSH